MCCKQSLQAKFLFILFVLFLGACSQPQPSVFSFGEADAGKRVEMQLGDQLEIVLPGNPGTGYGWEVVSDSAQNVQQVGEPEFKADTNLLDSPGNITLRFRAVSKGEQNLQLIYHRPWEKGVAPLNTYEITVNVK